MVVLMTVANIHFELKLLVCAAMHNWYDKPRV